MCGFAGCWGTPGRDDLHEVAARMADALLHRGPDDGGTWADPTAGYAVGFRRLAIIDLTPEGHQPMESAGGRYVIAFNGEVYNHAALRRELEGRGGVRFRGHSDTEVMLAAFEAWGVEAAVRKFAGMFAFALWDRRERTLTLARDRLGEKPLYYGRCGGTFVFGSELKALRRHPDFAGEVDRAALWPYLQQGCIPSPLSIYKGIYKLPPGCLLTARAASDTDSAPTPYWSASRAAEQARADRLGGPPAEMADRLEGVLRSVVGEQMAADVPLGAFLSGGVDSSTVVALMQAQSARPVRTYTVGFDGGEFDESAHARAVARHLGTDHTEVHVSPAEALAVIPELPDLYDEPFADSSQIPTHLVAGVARRHVTVSLSGDGGDEVFAGYPWYGRALRLWRRVRLLPAPLRRASAFALWAAAHAGRTALPEKTVQKVCKVADMLGHSRRPEVLHRWLVAAHWHSPHPILPGYETPDHWPGAGTPSGAGDLLTALQCSDMATYLPDDILVKVDRASMGVSLESRAPLLDHRVVEFALRVPPESRVRGGQAKWLLRQVLYRHVPRELIERPKQGFSVPMALWLRGPLRDWAESLLGERDLRHQGYFHAPTVRRLWEQHLSGRRDWQRHLWHLLMFQAWLRGQGRAARPEPAAAASV